MSKSESATKKLHDGEVDIDQELVRALLNAQCPKWSTMRIVEAPESGTVNAIYRLGDELYVRLPRAEHFESSLLNELRWLPRLAPRLPVAVPTPVAAGEPAAGYPFHWAIYRWMVGETYTSERVTDEAGAATTLAHFIVALRSIGHAEAPRSHRDEPLSERDTFTESSIAALPSSMNRQAVEAAWQQVLQAPAWDGIPAWIHGDLIPPNVLVHRGALNAVLDFGNVGMGDPAVDVIPAWSLFKRRGRIAFRAALDIKAPVWSRARGFALRQAIRIIPYYRNSDSSFAAMATRTVTRVVKDLRESGPNS